MVKAGVTPRLIRCAFVITMVQSIVAVGPLADVVPAAGEPTTMMAGSDFNGDGFADLALNVLDEKGETADAVVVLYGSTTGLRSTGRQRIVAADLGPPITEGPQQSLGRAMTTGNFDCDRYTDLALGETSARVGTVNGGAARIVFGSARGLDPHRTQLWTQDSPGVPGKAENRDELGSALVAGNFGGGREDDLAVTAWSESTHGLQEAGAVNVLYGSPQGLMSAGSQLWTSDTPGVPGTGEEFENFGQSLAAGRFSASGYDDLAVGVPNRFSVTGSVVVLRGSAGGLTTKGSQQWSQDSSRVRGRSEQNDDFGESLAAGQFGRGRYEDLAIGVPQETIAGREEAGAVNVLYGSSDGLTAAGNQLWSQQSRGVAGVPEVGDNFGQALVAANLGHDDATGEPIDDLAIAVAESIHGVSGAGQVHVLFGRQDGLASASSQILTTVSSGRIATPTMNDEFGAVLAAGNFGGSGSRSPYADLAARASANDGKPADQGGVHVIYGSSGGPDSRAGQLWTTRSLGERGATRRIWTLTADG